MKRKHGYYEEKDIIEIGRLRGLGHSREEAEEKICLANKLKKFRGIQ